MIKHGSLETFAYFLIWPSCVAISLYNLYLVGTNFNHKDHHVYQYDDFTLGWFNRFQDTSDFEWACWTKLMISLLPWLLVNSIGGEIIRRLRLSNGLSIWYFTVSFGAVVRIIGPLPAVLFTAITMIFYICTHFKQPVIIWVLGFLCRRYVPYEFVAKNEQDAYLIEVASSWLILRCFAYSSEAIRTRQMSLSTIFGYSLYLPTLFCGPFMPFETFHEDLVADAQPWNLKRVLLIAQSFARCIFWYFFTIVGLHFIYVNAILLRPYMVAEMSNWQLAGLGIAMGHFFHLKYIVFYGLPSAWANIEGYRTPKAPCCVSRVYLYSHMWRNFDPGLYSFLVRYIYGPVLGLSKTVTFLTRFVASVACFIFVYIWHGEEEYVLYWVLLNFTAVTLEAIGRAVYKTPAFTQKINRLLSCANQRRLHCLVTSPLHYFSMLSNYFFIGSLEVGKIYFIRAFQATFSQNLFILLFLYGAAQSTITIEMWEKSKQ